MPIDYKQDEEVLGLLDLELEKNFQQRVLVQVYLPHVKQYNPKFDPMFTLVYSWKGETLLSNGDLVICPPTPKHAEPFTGIVVSMDASEHPYKGPVKSLLGRA